MRSTKKSKAVAETENSEDKTGTNTAVQQTSVTKKSRARATAKAAEELKALEASSIIVEEEVKLTDSTPQNAAKNMEETSIVDNKNENTDEIEFTDDNTDIKDESKSGLKKEYKNLKKMYKTAKKVTKSFKKILKKVSKKEDSEIIYSTNLDYAEANGSRKALKKIIKVLKKRINSFKKK